MIRTSRTKVQYFSRSVEETERFDASLMCEECKSVLQLMQRLQAVQERQQEVQ